MVSIKEPHLQRAGGQVARQSPTVTAQLTDKVMTLHNGHDHDSGPVVVIVNDGTVGELRQAMVEMVGMGTVA